MCPEFSLSQSRHQPCVTTKVGLNAGQRTLKLGQSRQPSVNTPPLLESEINCFGPSRAKGLPSHAETCNHNGDAWTQRPWIIIRDLGRLDVMTTDRDVLVTEFTLYWRFWRKNEIFKMKYYSSIVFKFLWQCWIDLLRDLIPFHIFFYILSVSL